MPVERSEGLLSLICRRPWWRLLIWRSASTVAKSVTDNRIRSKRYGQRSEYAFHEARLGFNLTRGVRDAGPTDVLWSKGVGGRALSLKGIAVVWFCIAAIQIDSYHRQAGRREIRGCAVIFIPYAIRVSRSGRVSPIHADKAEGTRLKQSLVSCRQSA